MLFGVRFGLSEKCFEKFCMVRSAFLTVSCMRFKLMGILNRPALAICWVGIRTISIGGGYFPIGGCMFSLHGAGLVR